NPRSTYSRNDTSPIKLFEYMASGRPIVASSLPSIREILNEQNAFLVQPDNPEDLKRGIEKALGDAAVARQCAARAREDVRPYTWEKRAEAMLGFITKFAG
ncbi:MAG: glycosyltransferase, partial [Patescibacteria group bacterium]